MWPGLQKSAIWAQKIADFSFLLYHNLWTIIETQQIYICDRI